MVERSGAIHADSDGTCGMPRVRAELIDFVGEEAGKWFDQEIGAAHVRLFDVFVKDWTGASS